MPELTDPQHVFDFEFHFAGGDPIVVPGVPDGTWTLRPLKEGNGLIFQVRHGAGIVDEWSINQTALLYLRTTKREVSQEVAH